MACSVSSDNALHFLLVGMCIGRSQKERRVIDRTTGLWSGEEKLLLLGLCGSTAGLKCTVLSAGY